MISPFEKFVLKYSRLPTEFDPEYLELLHMGKFRILDVPDVSPGKCSNCGSSKNDGRKYIDIGLHIEWYGAFYLCGLCLNELAEAMGLYADLRAHLFELQRDSKTVGALQEQGERLHETVISVFREFEEFYANLPTPSVDSDSDSNSSESSVGDEKSSLEQGHIETESGIVKSPTSSGSKNVRSTTKRVDDS
jgi:hypothetical protein